jgi:CBS domain-containing protein
MDWLAAGLPSEGKGASRPRARDVVRAVPICRLDEAVSAAADRVRSVGADSAVVVTAEGVVLGVLELDALSVRRASGRERVETLMRGAPPTVRPHAPLEKLAARMHRDGHQRFLVTRQDGTLIGVLLREDVESLAGGVLAAA